MRPWRAVLEGLGSEGPEVIHSILLRGGRTRDVRIQPTHFHRSNRRVSRAVEAMSTAKQIEQELEASEPWRRARQFITKPYGQRDREEAKRFMKNFMDAAEGESMPGDEWTLADVFNGDHEGGSNNPIGGGPAAVVASKTRKSNVRMSKAMAVLKAHMTVDSIKEHLRVNFANDPEGAVTWFQQNECGGATPEPAVNEIKAEMTAATVLGAVGYKLGSVSSFALYLGLIRLRNHLGEVI